MSGNDIFQSISRLDPEGIQKVVDRLEFRGRDPIFVGMRETYLKRIDLGACKALLDLGCGTGVVTRALAGHNQLAAEITGIDFSPELIEAATRLAADEGLAGRVTFRTGDSHALPDADNSYDVVLAHTLVSHVRDPGAVIAEAARVLRPGGTVAIFDGDYASLTFGNGDVARNAEIVDMILGAVVANPYVLREMPALLADHGLSLKHFLPEVLAEARTGSFFLNMADSYIPMVVQSGNLSEDEAAAWLSAQHFASDKGAFFGACNYYTYVAQKS